MENKGNDKVMWINGLKGFLCCTVVMLHMQASFFSETMNARTYLSSGSYNFISLTPLNILFNGSFAVYVFWTISGFLMTYLWVEYDLNVMLRRLLNKYFKIVFIATFICIFSYILLKIGCYYNVSAGEYMDNTFLINERDYSVVTFGHLIKDIMWNNFFGPTTQFITPLWTMPYEIKGCCLIALILLLRQEHNRTLLFAIIVCLLFSGKYTLYMTFILGASLGMQYREQNKTNYRWGGVLLILGVVLGAYPPSGTPESGIYYVIYKFFILNFNRVTFAGGGVVFLYVISAALILMGIMRVQKAQKILSLKFFQFLGDRSIYVYLVHIPIMMSLVSYVFYVCMKNTNNFITSVAAAYIAVIISLLISVQLLKILNERVFSIWSKRIVEKIILKGNGV